VLRWGKKIGGGFEVGLVHDPYARKPSVSYDLPMKGQPTEGMECPGCGKIKDRSDAPDEEPWIEIELGEGLLVQVCSSLCGGVLKNRLERSELEQN
jgi:hypothetical protein